MRGKPTTSNEQPERMRNMWEKGMAIDIGWVLDELGLQELK